MTNFRRRQTESADGSVKVTSLTASRARDILTSEDVSVRDAVIAGGLLRLPLKETIG